MFDMGYKMKDMPETISAGKSKNKIQYPSLNLYEKVPPDLMNKEIGSMCHVEIIGKVISKGINERNGNKREELVLEIHQMGYIGKGGKATRDEYLNMDKKKREEYDKKDKGITDEDRK